MAFESVHLVGPAGYQVNAKLLALLAPLVIHGLLAWPRQSRAVEPIQVTRLCSSIVVWLTTTHSLETLYAGFTAQPQRGEVVDADMIMLSASKPE